MPKADGQNSRGDEDASGDMTWIDHDGGNLMAPASAFITVENRAGRCITDRALNFYWFHKDMDSDIMRYRFVRGKLEGPALLEGTCSQEP